MTDLDIDHEFRTRHHRWAVRSCGGLAACGVLWFVLLVAAGLWR
jgi:hypothetical protein